MALAPAEQLELMLALEQVAGLVAAGDDVGDHLGDLARGQALDDGLDGLLGDVHHELARVELAELIPVVGEQAARDEHHQHRVVALERREHVGVGLQRREPVDAQVAGAAAAFPSALDGLGGVPARGRLHRRGERLEPALFALGRLAGGLALVEALEQLRLGEVERVRLRQQRHQPALVGAVVEQRDLRLHPADRTAFAAARSAPRSSARSWPR